MRAVVLADAMPRPRVIRLPGVCGNPAVGVDHGKLPSRGEAVGGVELRADLFHRAALTQQLERAALVGDVGGGLGCDGADVGFGG